MAITSKGLKQLGFKSGVDYSLEDDGSGVKIIWSSSQPQPTEAEIETAQTQYDNALTAISNDKKSGRDKLVALGLTTDELDALGII
jgi:hypothetical protein